MSEQLPLKNLVANGDEIGFISEADDQTYGMFCPSALWFGVNPEVNARRIVACVNACEGIPTDALIATCYDANDLKDFDLVAYALIERVGLRGELELTRQQRDELLAALKAALEFTLNGDGLTHEQVSAFNRVIAKAES